MANAKPNRTPDPSKDLKFTFGEDKRVQILFPEDSAEFVARIADELRETIEDYDFTGFELMLRGKQPKITLLSTFSGGGKFLKDHRETLVTICNDLWDLSGYYR